MIYILEYIYVLVSSIGYFQTDDNFHGKSKVQLGYYIQKLKDIKMMIRKQICL